MNQSLQDKKVDVMNCWIHVLNCELHAGNHKKRFN